MRSGAFGVFVLALRMWFGANIFTSAAAISGNSELTGHLATDSTGAMDKEILLFAMADGRNFFNSCGDDCLTNADYVDQSLSIIVGDRARRNNTRNPISVINRNINEMLTKLLKEFFIPCEEAGKDHLPEESDLDDAFEDRLRNSKTAGTPEHILNKKLIISEKSKIMNRDNPNVYNIEDYAPSVIEDTVTQLEKSVTVEKEQLETHAISAATANDYASNKGREHVTVDNPRERKATKRVISPDYDDGDLSDEVLDPEDEMLIDHNTVEMWDDWVPSCSMAFNILD